MKTYIAEETAVINVPAEQAYRIIADYVNWHHKIIPSDNFEALEVKKGGVGAGTEFYVRFKVLGVQAEYNMVVTEPEPGRILREVDAEQGVVTDFIVEPDNEQRCHVTIHTAMPVKPGVAGWIESKINPIVMRRLWREELANLDRVAQTSMQPLAS